MSHDFQENKPPLFKTWAGWYIFVAAMLVAEIVLFYFMTLRFS